MTQVIKVHNGLHACDYQKGYRSTVMLKKFAHMKAYWS